MNAWHSNITPTLYLTLIIVLDRKQLLYLDVVSLQVTSAFSSTFISKLTRSRLDANRMELPTGILMGRLMDRCEYPSTSFFFTFVTQNSFKGTKLIETRRGLNYKLYTLDGTLVW
jgi:hypothetical protein